MEAIPEGWGTRLHSNADLAASIGELDSAEGHQAESLRGRIRSLQLRLREASAHFRMAAEIHRASPEKTDPLQLQMAEAYERENSLLRGKPTPRRSAQILAASDWKLKAIESLHRSLDAFGDLHEGNAASAAVAYRELLAENDDAGPERKALWNLGIAVAQIQLCSHREALRRLEVAGLHVCEPGCRTLGRVQISADLAHVHEFLGEAEVGRDWRRLIDCTRCPEATREAMRKRADLLARRSLTLGRCVLI